MRVSLTRSLVKVSLDDIIAGETCEPISLSNFESYLLYKQHSVEYLRFVVWFQSYRQRFCAVPQNLQALSPAVSVSKPNSCDGPGFKMPTPARIARYVSGVSDSTTIASPSVFHPEFGTQIGLCPTTTRSTTRMGAPLTMLSSTSTTDPDEKVNFAQQPFRAECAAAAHTFLASSDNFHFTSVSLDSHILDIPSYLLESVLHNIAHTTHPSVFEPIYDIAYSTLTTSSLPFFLSDAAKNVNHQKTMYWWIVGLITFVFGWAIGIGCLFIDYGDDTDGGNRTMRQRAWRLFAVPLLTLGGMQMYSASRGFCSQVWGRGATQLRPWELLVPSDEPVAPTIERREPKEVHMHEFGIDEISEKPLDAEAHMIDCTQTSEADCTLHDFGSQQPLHGIHLDFASPGPIRVGPTSSAPSSISECSGSAKIPRKVPAPIVVPQGTYRDSWGLPPTPELSDAGGMSPMTPWTPTSPSARAMLRPRTPGSEAHRDNAVSNYYSSPRDSNGNDSASIRARIFGPERPVLDPRIRSAHRRVMRNILCFGFVWGVVWTAIVCVLPWRR